MSNSDKKPASGSACDLYARNKKEIIGDVVAYSAAALGVGTLTAFFPSAITVLGSAVFGFTSVCSWHELWKSRKAQSANPS